MSDIWIRTLDGDLLQADRVRQITSIDGLRVVLAGGSQFLIADISRREPCEIAAQDLAAAIAEARSEEGAVLISVTEEQGKWVVAPLPLINGKVRAS